MSKGTGYYRVLDELAERIEALVPQHPEILDLSDPFELFRVPGFACGDLDPTLAQASAALGEVKERHRLRRGPYKKVSR
jgi:hypothetical protein